MYQRAFQTEPDHCATCDLRGAALCRAVTRAGMVGARPPRQRQVERDETLVEDGAAPTFFGVLRRGYLRRERLQPDGRRTLLGLACPGDIVGGLPDSPCACAIEAATDAEICAFDIPTVTRMIVENPQFRHFVLREAVHQHESILDMIWLRGALTSRERIVAFLVMATEIMPTETLPDGSLVVTIELSRRDWADLSNTSVESISRTIGWLSEKELVTTVAPSRYRIRNLRLLTRLAGIDPELDRKPRSAPQLDEQAQPRVSELSRSRLTAINAAPSAPVTVDRVRAAARMSPGPDKWRFENVKGQGKDRHQE